MEKAGANQTTAASWSHVVRGHIPSQTGENNSDSNCENQVRVEGIDHNNELRRLQSPSPSTSSSTSQGELLFGSQSEFWPVLGQAPTGARSPTPSAASASTTSPIPSSAIRDKQASDVVGHRIAPNVAVSRGGERNHHVSRERNAPNRPFLPQGSERDCHVPREKNAPHRPVLSQGSERNGYRPRGRNPNRPFSSQGSERNDCMPPRMNVPNGSVFPPNTTNIAYSAVQHHRGHGYPPRGGYGNINSNMHGQREYNYNWNSQQNVPGINNVPIYGQYCPMNNMTQPSQPLLPFVDGVTNPFYMNVAPMPTLFFPNPIYLDSSSGGPRFMPSQPPAPTMSQTIFDLRKKIIKQVDYYFSADNLCKDTYLRRHMDENCWAPISLVAGFKRMMELTNDVNLVLDALRDSTVVELQGDKIRRKNDWFNWPNPNLFVGFQKQGNIDGSSSSETASELGTSERVFPERDSLEDVLDPKKNDKEP